MSKIITLNNKVAIYNNQVAKIYTFNPSEILGLKLWLKSDTGITKDGSNYVNTWEDQSGNNNNATQLTLASQPLWVSNQLNGYPVISFDGINDFLEVLNSLNIINLATIFIVYNTKDSTYNPLLVKIATTPTFYLISVSNNPQTRLNYPSSPNYLKWTNVQPSPYNVTSIIYNGNNSKSYINSVDVTDVSLHDVSTGSIDSIWIGKLYEGGAEYLYGNFVEIMIYNSVLSDVNRVKVENYLKTKYNL